MSRTLFFLIIWGILVALIYLMLWGDYIYYKHNIPKFCRKVLDAFTEEE